MARRSSAPGGGTDGGNLAGLKMFRAPLPPVSANPRPDHRDPPRAACTNSCRWRASASWRARTRAAGGCWWQTGEKLRVHERFQICTVDVRPSQRNYNWSVTTEQGPTEETHRSQIRVKVFSVIFQGLSCSYKYNLQFSDGKWDKNTMKF